MTAFTTRAVRDAATTASSAWGGKYYPMIGNGGWENQIELLEGLGVDFLTTVTDDEQAVKQSRGDGFDWTGRAQYGPFAPAFGSISMRTLQPHHLARPDDIADSVSPRWSEDDPLDDLFAVWFGDSREVDGDAQGQNLPTKSEVVRIKSSEPCPHSVLGMTPVELTGVHIDYTGESAGFGVVPVDPSNPTDLKRFWNIRACGGSVLPWPIGHEHFVAGVTRAWLGRSLEAGQLPVGRLDGHEGPFVRVWSGPNSDSRSLLPALHEMLDGFDVKVWAENDFISTGWMGTHPLTTTFTKSFDVDVAARASVASIPLPEIAWAPGSPPSQWFGTVAADVTVYSESEVDPERTAVIPRVRRLAKSMPWRDAFSNAFQRPNGRGGIFSVLATDEFVQIPLVQTISIFEGLFDNADVVFDQSDEGRFATRLGQMLGGPDSVAATQPAVRELLLRASKRDISGMTISELEQRALDSRGEWPDPLRSRDQTPEDYARSLIFWLTRQGLIRTFLPITCPACRSGLRLVPADLEDEVHCEFCGERFNLAFALAWLGRKADWVYRIAGHVAESRLRSALPILAANSALSAPGGIRRSSKLSGLTVLRESQQVSEFDLAIVIDPERPQVLLGEVKAYGSQVDQKDVDSLSCAQKQLRAKSIECFIAMATFRESLSREEVLMLRTYAESAPRVLSNDITATPVTLPIVLTGRQLSVHHFSDDHPFKWGQPGRGLAPIARRSCNTNLGLQDIRWSSARRDWEFQWSAEV